jgi:DNA polymerase-3 subunit epsilon
MVSSLPPKIVFLDTETTGLTSEDRIVSFAGILLETADLPKGGAKIDLVHLIFNPGRRSHAMAKKAHGHADRTLERQNPFSAFASHIHGFIHEADLVVAHNADFDLRFLNRELTDAGLPIISRPSFCTFQAWRKTGNGPATLDAVAQQIGLARETKEHSPLEDSWLAMMVYLALHETPLEIEFASLKCQPTNWVDHPPKLKGSLQSRRESPSRRIPAPSRV